MRTRSTVTAAERGRWRRWTRVAGVLLLAPLSFALVFPLGYAAIAPEQRGAPVTLPMPPAGQYRVLVVDWGYHTAIVIEQPPGWSLGPPGEERAPLLEYAWGDRRFYLLGDLRPHSVFASVALPTSSVLYLDGLPAESRFAGARTVDERTVDAATLQRLAMALEGSIRRTATRTRDVAMRNPAHPGFFYPAYGRYLWTRSCNWWTVERLRDAGLATSATGIVFSGQVRERLRGFREAGGGKRVAE